MMIITIILYFYVSSWFWSIFRHFAHCFSTFIIEHMMFFCMLFMLWWVVKETGESHHGCPCYCKSSTYCTSGFAFTLDSFLPQQYMAVSEALKCTVLMDWIIPVKTYCLYRSVKLALSRIYIYTHLLNVSLLDVHLDYCVKPYRWI